MTIDLQTKARIAKVAAACKYDPLKWAQNAWDWGNGALEDKTLRQWQTSILGEIRDHLSNPETRYMPFRKAVASGHGIGKSALMSIIGNWGLTCHEGSRIVVTANTEGQLRTKTSPEFAKWFRTSLSAPLFDIDTLRIAMDEKNAKASWRLDFTPWSENNTEALAGLHNEGKFIAILMDEGSAIPDLIWEVIEGALTDENTIILWIVFGNPTRNTGRFRECFRRHRNLWSGTQIDSSTVEGTNKELFKEWAETYGFDSDFYKVRVRGQFPSASSRQFIATDVVEAALGKHLEKHQYEFAPVIITCDPAWTGDDELIIAMRQGLYFDILDIIRSNDNDVFIANKIANYEVQYEASAVFIDAGYGTGIKSAGDTMGRDWQLVWFAGAAVDKGVVNKRTEMWRDMREWLKMGGSIPDDQTLFDDLIGPETLPRLDGKVALESKEQMRNRGLPSPNRADALALSFAFPVSTATAMHSARKDGAVVLQEEFNPWS